MQVLAIAALLLLAPVAVTTADEPQLPRVPATEPADALRSFVVRDGFEMQLIAAEPLVTDPVAIEYDEDGRAYVAEMRDYPFTDKTADKPFTEKATDLPLGRIRRLVDRNGDGTFDDSTIFADSLSWPTGLAVWKGGIYVVATPDLWYLKDTDNDGVSDVREKVLTGFRKFNVQAVINNLKWGPDHWLYGAGSSNGGQLRGENSAAPPLVMATGDFRFRANAVGDTFELLSGGARFGNTFDDWGHRFICNIRNPIQQVILPRALLARNPHAAFPAAVHDVAVSGDAVRVWRSSPPEPWRIRNARRLADDPTTASPRSETVAAGYLTSSSGVTVYRGDAYPAEFYGTVFLGEVAGNLIHHQKLTRDGVAYSSRRTIEQGEFLTSTDNWFRPVNFVNAPDGTLHVLDMNRETIEHPWSIPDDIKALVDLESGRDRGRIYRLAPKGFQVPKPPQLSSATTAELTHHLANPESWYRETAHRLLFERQDKSAVPLLQSQLKSLQQSSPGSGEDPGADRTAAARVLTLRALEGLNGLTTNDLLLALRDSHFAVRSHAVRLAEPFLKTDAEISRQILSLSEDSDPEVRFQTAFALYALLSDDVAPSLRSAAQNRLARIAVRDAADPFVRAAVLSSVAENAIPVTDEILKSTERLAAPVATMLVELGKIVGARNRPDEFNLLFATAEAASTRPDSEQVIRALAVGFGQGLQKSNQRLTTVLSSQSTSPGARRMKSELDDALAAIADRSSRVSIHSPDSSAQDSLLAELTTFGEFNAIRAALTTWLTAEQSVSTQSRAVGILARFREEDVANLLLDAYRGLRSPARSEAVELLVSRREWHPALLTAIESGTIPLFDIPPLRRNLLLRSADPDVKARSVKLFAASLAVRKEVVVRYRDQLPLLTPDPAAGESIYRRECQACHRLGHAGQELGPNLVTIRNRARDEVLLHILDPNREVAPNFVAQVVVTADGRILTGLVTDETSHQLTLRQSTGPAVVLERAAIDEITSTGQSLMPVGFEQKISPQEMANLLEYLLNQPLSEPAP